MGGSFSTHTVHMVDVGGWSFSTHTVHMVDVGGCVSSCTYCIYVHTIHIKMTLIHVYMPNIKMEISLKMKTSSMKLDLSYGPCIE